MASTPDTQSQTKQMWIALAVGVSAIVLATVLTLAPEPESVQPWLIAILYLFGTSATLYYAAVFRDLNGL